MIKLPDGYFEVSDQWKNWATEVTKKINELERMFDQARKEERQKVLGEVETFATMAFGKHHDNYSEFIKLLNRLRR